MRHSQQQGRALETPDATEARQHQDADFHRRRRQLDLTVPLLHQSCVQSKIKNFHSKLAALQVSKCVTCLESFPALSVKAISPDSNSTECTRCTHDKHIPKLYLSGNNMDPGPVPSELQVCSISYSLLPMKDT